MALNVNNERCFLLPFFAVSTAPKELREVDMNAKMSKSKKKKLKKRAKRNQALMEETMQHIEEREELEKSGGEKANDNNMDEAISPSSPETSAATATTTTTTTTNGAGRTAAQNGGDKDSISSASGVETRTAAGGKEGGEFVDDAKVDGESVLASCSGCGNYIFKNLPRVYAYRMSVRRFGVNYY